MIDRPLRTAAILSTGDELLLGRTVDTNSAEIADRLSALGLEVVSMTTVGDHPERLAAAWRELLAGADLVVSTGGLGPTIDDLTNETLAAVAGVDLVLDEEQATHIRRLFAERGREMSENNLRQAHLPRGAVVVPNPLGTAPGYRIAIAAGGRDAVGVVLPGVPREMRRMLEDTVVPWVTSKLSADTVLRTHTFQTFGLPESEIDQRLAGAIPDAGGCLAFRASFPKIAVRVQVRGAGAEADARLAGLVETVRTTLADVVYAEGEAGMEDVVGELLRERSKTLATAESCTGGRIGQRITSVAGSSEYYSGGFVTYSNDLKERMLGVRSETLQRYGAVSEPTAIEMADGARERAGADLAVATTGVAGPGGGSEDKPVGTVVVALAAAGEATRAITFRFGGTREWIQVLTAQVALDWVRRSLLGLDPPDWIGRAPRPAGSGAAA